MTWRQFFIGLLSAILAAGTSVAQMTIEQAREEGKAMGQAKRGDSSLVPDDNAQAEAVPGYSGTSLPEGRYFDDPDKLVADANAVKSSNDAYNVVTDAAKTRPTFSNADILGVTDRGTAVGNDPNAYLDGEAIGAVEGTCTPLPPGAATAGYYEASCNVGAKVEETPLSCNVPLVVNATLGTAKYVYSCEGWVNDRPSNAGRRCGAFFDAPVASGVCRERSRETVQYSLCLQGEEDFCSEPDVRQGERITYECDSAAVSRPYNVETVGEVVTQAKNEALCTAATNGKTCEPTSQTCIDPTPATRVINGVPVTRACWGWSRSYTCNAVTTGNDCGELAGNPTCTYQHDTCLDDPQEGAGGGACRTVEKIYKCKTPHGASRDTNQYICGGDVYCINGDCEPIVREASTEFKDALVALHAIDQAGKEFDEANFTVFKGKRETCHKPVFGLINCCAGKVSGVVPVAAGAAALAGGPAAIAAFATPFLTMFTCSQSEMQLDIKDRMGFCHKVGTYCSSSLLGICRTKRSAYCCFESKLSRVLAQQGRIQLGKPWGPPRTEQCDGFTIEAFASLDLSLMDFTEVYADFMDAAKLPHEVETMAQIQGKIEAYYDLHGT